jgi:lysophospholipase L1-like esterase
MFDTLGHVVMKLFMLAWIYSSPHSWLGLPLPEAGPPVVVAGTQPQRILLCGSGIVVGYGVTSHELALGGALARSLAALTRRGAEVATIAAPRLSTKTARSRLTADVLEGLDAVVLSFGSFDLLTFLPARKWGQGMHELVDCVLSQTPSSTHVFIVDCAAAKMSNFTPAYRRHLVVMTEAYNDEVKALTQKSERVHQINFAPEPKDAESIEGRQNYHTWAEAIAPTIANELRGHQFGA